MKKWTQFVTIIVTTALTTVSVLMLGLVGAPTTSATADAAGSNDPLAQNAPGAVMAEDAPAEQAPQAQQAQAGLAMAAGSPGSEQIFVPITACRIAITSNGGGVIGNGQTRSFYVRGTFGFAPQGGKAGGCGVPDSATAVALNVTAFGAAGNGYLSAAPFGTTPGGTSFAQFYSDRQSTTNPILTLSASTPGQDLNLKPTNSSVQVALDVTGYYAPQIAGIISSTGGKYQGTSRYVSSTSPSVGFYQVTLDTDVSACSAVVTPYSNVGSYAASYTLSGTTLYIYSYRISGGAPVLTNNVLVNFAILC